MEKMPVASGNMINFDASGEKNPGEVKNRSMSVLHKMD